ncbi:MAG: type IV pilus twitching motility protein PilT, partial [Acidobacteriota bacterium]
PAHPNERQGNSMARLDGLIELLRRKKAEALELSPGQQPALLLEGQRRPVVNQVLDAFQVIRLVSEIAPVPARAALGRGEPVSFGHVAAGVQVSVMTAPGGQVRIQLADGTPPPSPPAGLQGGAVTSGSLGMERYFRLMLDRGASDLHLSSGAAPLLRVDGQMVAAGEDRPLSDEVLTRIFQEITPQHNWEEYARENDTDFAHEIAGLCRFRCNLFRDRRGPGGVFRAIPAKIMTADDLELPPAVRDLSRLTKGLVLVTGPTGSGKSTTLTALVDLINSTRSAHIITIEDPIEFVHPNRRCLVNQREVHVHTTGFKRALRAALREDPDIVLVGEMRDLETVSIALETAETGHLVFGTLHTTSAMATVDRLVDQFPPQQQAQIRVMLAETLKAIIAQVLCRKKGGGRVAALEILIAMPAISNLIREGKTFQIASMMQTGRKHGMRMLHDALLDLVRKGIVEPREAYLHAADKTALLAAFRSSKISMDFLQAETLPPFTSTGSGASRPR